MDDRIVVPLVVVAGILARLLLWGMVPVTGDAVYHYSVARYIAVSHSIPSFEYQAGGDPFWYPPAFHLAASFFHVVFGSERLAPLFFSILSLFAFYALLKRFYGDLLLPGMVLAAFLPTQLYYGAVGYVESLLFLLAPLILYCYLRFLKTKDCRMLSLTLLLSAASFLTHYEGFIPLAAVSAHLLLRDKKLAVVFLVVGLALVSPWYLRNYVVFGNPVWPLLFDGKYPMLESYQPSKIVNILSPSKWSSLFFEYWVGAPNSGEDILRNVEVAGSYSRFSGLLFAAWLLLILALTLMALYGLFKLLKEDANRSLFLLFILFSLVPLLLSNFVRMLVFVFPIIILGLSRFLSSFRFKLKITGVFINISMRFSSLAARLNELFSLSKRVALVLVVLGLVSPCFAYAFVYAGIVDKYAPFYAEVNAELPKDAVVCNMMDDVFFSNVDRKIVSITTLSNMEGRVKLGCLEGALAGSSDSSGCFREEGVEYVCCSSLRTGNIGGPVAETCAQLAESKAVVDYASDGVWGGCWRI